jgi:PleD family two-component response regulator
VLANSIPKVLIVDDEASNVVLLCKTLEQGYEVMTASSGSEALVLARAHDPDIILLDVIMPEMDGFEVCRQLKSDDRLKDIPVIFISALDDTQDETEGLQLGAIDYITKPISPGIVRARVKNHVELKRSRDLLAQLSQVDGLTGIANRRAFDEKIETELRRMKRAERLRESVEAAQLEHESSSTGDVVTISLGAASVNPSDEATAEGVLKTADTNLYKAKEAGRNRVVAG